MSYFDYPSSGHMIGTLSLLGLYSYDDTIFDNFALPTGLDKDNIITMLCAETADCELLYPNPILMKKLIKSWSEMRLPTWQKVYDAVTAEYGVLDEYDYHETTYSKTEADGTGDSKTTQTGTNTTTSSTSGRGFDSSSMVQTNSDTSTNSPNLTNDTDTSFDNTTEVNGTKDVTGRNKNGAELVKQAIDAAMNNLYDIIMSEFKERFIILVY